MFTQILGVILLILGPFVVIKTEWFLALIGRIDWAEQHLGGGTRFFLKLLGILFIFLGLLMIFNLFGPLAIWLLGPVLPKS